MGTDDVSLRAAPAKSLSPSAARSRLPEARLWRVDLCEAAEAGGRGWGARTHRSVRDAVAGVFVLLLIIIIIIHIYIYIFPLGKAPRQGLQRVERKQRGQMNLVGSLYLGWLLAVRRFALWSLEGFPVCKLSCKLLDALQQVYRCTQNPFRWLFGHSPCNLPGKQQAEPHVWQGGSELMIAGSGMGIALCGWVWVGVTGTKRKTQFLVDPPFCDICWYPA